MRNSFSEPISCAICILFLMALIGCTYSIGPTKGIVRFDDGSSLTSGSIEFRNVANGNCLASRVTNQGVFYPVNIDGKIGLPAGTYEVIIVQIVLAEDLAKKDHSHGHTVPRRYADYNTSGLSVTVTADQTKPIEIAIRAKAEE